MSLECSAVAEQCLEPLVAAQELSLLHRDIKPGNIMLTQLASGKYLVKMLDFGLAKFSQQPSLQTLDQSGSFLGSIDYIAPEQLELHPLDQRTDLYSLGCVLYFCLAQKAPFTGANPAQTSSNHLSNHCQHIKEVRKDLPEALGVWLMRLIQRQPDDRPASAREAAKALAEARRGKIPAGWGEVDALGPVSEPVSVTPPPQQEDEIAVAKAAEPTAPKKRIPAAPATGVTRPAPSSGKGPRKPQRSAGAGKSTRPQRPAPKKQPTRKTGASRPSTQPQGSSSSGGPNKPLLIGIGAAIAAVMIVGLILILSGDGGDDQAVVSPVEPRPTAPVEGQTPSAPSDSETGSALPPPVGALPVIAKPSQPLPYPSEQLQKRDSMTGVPSLAASDGLVLRYGASYGLRGLDYVRSAAVGDLVAGWLSLVPPQNPEDRMWIQRDYTDQTGELLPVLGRFGPGDFSKLRGVYRSLVFPEDAVMSHAPISIEPQGGWTIYLILQVPLEPGQVFRFVSPQDTNRRVFFHFNDQDALVATVNGEGIEKPNPRIIVPWNTRQPGIFTYVWIQYTTNLRTHC
ncbi:MAG: protein kinase [Verrucomicrobiota bacterium]